MIWFAMSIVFALGFLAGWIMYGQCWQSTFRKDREDFQRNFDKTMADAEAKWKAATVEMEAKWKVAIEQHFSGAEQ